MSPEEYLDQAAQLLVADGSSVSRVGLPGGTALVGYRAQFKLRWVATKLHLFTVYYPTQTATPEQLAPLGRDGVEYAKRTKGSLRGLQSGVAVIPVLVGATATEPAVAMAAQRPEKEFAAFLLPALVDLGAGRRVSYEGRLLWGGIYAGWLRDRIAATVPVPSRG